MRGTRQAVIFAARKAYYDARLAVELKRASADAVSVAQRHLEDVDKNVKAGKLSDFDRLRAEVELKTLIAQNVQDENRYHVALTTLLNVLGVSQESQIELSEPLHYRPLTPALEESRACRLHAELRHPPGRAHDPPAARGGQRGARGVLPEAGRVRHRTRSRSRTRITRRTTRGATRGAPGWR